MAAAWAKNPRVKLAQERYRELHRSVLQRDGWRCQICGGMRNLQVHHVQFRSHSGSDSEENLMALCADCHARVHRLQRKS